jgi:DNA-binding SARP family transcriptional activator
MAAIDDTSYVSDHAAFDLGERHRHHEWPKHHGLARRRLLDRLQVPARLTLVVAPAGYGKTTLLAQYASEVSSSIVWHRADQTDVEPSHFRTKLTRLLAAASALERTPRSDDVDDFLNTISATQDAVKIVVDDAHVLQGSPTERLIEQLLHGSDISIVLAARRTPDLNVCRAEVQPMTLITADDLRFRSWETERLFRDVYQAPLPPDDIAALTRHVDGWAACLQLFHLSTQSRPTHDRHQAIQALVGGPRFARAYLARTVLDELPEGLRTFLTRTSVFEMLTAQRCDWLLETDDSQQRLEGLERLEALTTSDDGGRTFRCHDVLRRHLEGALFEDIGANETKKLYSLAADLLERLGALGEAVRAYLRAGRWEEANRLLRAGGDRVVDVEHATVWHDLLSPRLVDEDPWLSMVAARQLVCEGRFEAAIQRYRCAESLFPDPRSRERASWDRRLVELWTGGRRPQPKLHWLDRLRAAVRRHPDAITAAPNPTPGDQLCAAIASLLAGRVRGAETASRLLLEDPASGGILALAARLVQATIDLATDNADEVTPDRLANDAERAGAAWLARQAQVLSGLHTGDLRHLTLVADRCAAVGDGWGALLARAAGAAWRLFDGEPSLSRWREVAQECRDLGADSIEAWALAFGALAAAGEHEPHAAELAREAESFARACGVWGAQALTALALAAAEPRSRAAHAQQARSLAAMHGLPWPSTLADRLLVGERPITTSAPGPKVRLRCFGKFAFDIADRTLDWRRLRPRAASMLRLLAIHTPTPVHREELMLLWPDLPTAKALHSLQVAVSTLRSFLAPDAPRGTQRMVLRQGDAYALILPPGSHADVVTFANQLKEAERARQAHHADHERSALALAIDSYGGDLLPEDGPAEWVTTARERCRLQAAAGAARLAELGLECGELHWSIDAATRSISLDRFQDGPWRVLIEAHVRAGDAAAAARARHHYAAMLSTLGVPQHGSPSS